ncbi:RNA polymerase sigma-70 factor [Streptomyces sp.]|uniref:RNA polymerase sigma-70 factor n=1 Tax=Streptomyces sp. TaxID=1931 RepID=UPI002F4090B7
MGDPAEEFEQHRPLLLGLAYRLLGSMWDAEDVVQDAFLRWVRADRTGVREPRAYLMTVVSRLAIDQLRSARVAREEYPGPWLPEPAETLALGPLDTAELRDTVSYAMMHLMERLSPPERAVFVLREAFDVPYEEIAEILGTSTANCRQLHHRAHTHVARGRGRFQLSREDHLRLLTHFLHASHSGDVTALASMFSEDVMAWNDGGGKVRAALRPVSGRSKVAAFVTGLLARYPSGQEHIVDFNGELTLQTSIDGGRQFVAFDIRDGLIHGIFAVLNPDKLRRLDPALGS